MTGEPDQRLADVAAVARAFLAATAETKPDTRGPNCGVSWWPTAPTSPLS